MLRIVFQLLLLASVIFVQTQNLDDNLLLYYPFNGNAIDASENGFDGIIFGATLTDDRFGEANSAYYFDGVDDYIEFPNSNILKPQLPVSFSFWIKYDETDANHCVVFNTSFEDNRCAGVFFTIQNSTKRYSVGYGDGTYNYGSSTRRSFVSNFKMDADEWHFVAAIVTEPQRMNVYADCEWASGGKYSGEGGSLAYSSNPGNIGRHDQDLHLPAYYFKGTIDEFRYWNRGLTTADIDSLCLISSINNGESFEENLSVYPNPFEDWLTVSLKTETSFAIKIIDQMGAVNYDGTNNKRIDLSSFSPGLYIVQIKTSEGKSFSEKILKR